MKLEYEFTFKEYDAINACRMAKKSFSNLREILYWALAAFCISFGMSSMNFIFRKFGEVSLASVILIMLGIGMFLWRFVIYPMHRRWHFNQQILNGKMIRIEALPKSITFSTDDVITTQKWSGVFQANEMPDHFILWVNKLQAHSIPKSSFSDEKQIQTFRELVANNVTNQDIVK